MKTNQNALAKFMAVAILADGQIDELERDLIAETSECLGLNSLAQEVDAELVALEKLDEAELDNALKAAAKQVVKEEHV